MTDQSAIRTADYYAGLKMAAAGHFFNHNNAAARIASLFLALLEQQFPVKSPDQPLKTKTAHAFAQQLFIHVNHLNRSMKLVTGKSTSAHIAERIMAEAHIMLQYTDWNIGEIAYALGFEYPAHFNNFYKKRTGTTPTDFRVSIRV